jgi:hypothetical protein
MKLTYNYTLFIDESGQFSDYELQNQRDKNREGSQIAGVLYQGKLLHTPDQDLPQELLALFPLHEESHGMEESDQIVLAKFKQALRFIDVEGSKYELTRIVNNSGLGEGSVTRTYTHMVAELIVRLYAQLRERHPEGRVVIDLMYAVVKIGKRYQGRDYFYAQGHIPSEVENDGHAILIKGDKYKEAIRREVIEEVIHGLGVHEFEAHNILGDLKERSARRHPMLRLCDLISNLSYNYAQRLTSAFHERDRLQTLLAPLDFQLHPLRAELIAEELADHHALGQALLFVLTELGSPDLSKVAKRRLKLLTKELTRELSALPEDERSRELATLRDALTDLVQRVRDSERAERLYQDLCEHVIDPLAALLEGTEGALRLKGERFELLNQALANANHAGDIKRSVARREALLALYPEVAHRYELIEVLFEGRLNVAMSYHDTFEFERGVEIAESVVAFYQELQAVIGGFADAGLLAPNLNVPLCGRALGASMQIQRALITRGEGDVERAHELGSEALAEFSSSPANRARVYQQFAHLEALEGEFESAWGSLLLGLTPERSPLEGLDACRVACVDWVKARDLKDLSTQFVSAFGVMHALRLSCLHAWAEPSSIGESTHTLLKHTEALIQQLQEAGCDDYPLHALMRYSAELAAHHGEVALTTKLIQELFLLCDMPAQHHKLSLAMIPLCGALSCAAVLARQGLKEEASVLITLKGLVAFGTAKRCDQLSERFKGVGAPKVSTCLSTYSDLITQLNFDEPEHIKRLYTLGVQLPL